MSDLGANLAEDFEAAPAAGPPPKVTRGAKAAPKAASVVSDKVTLVLEENENIPPTGLFVGLNGRGYLIRPGDEVTVPRGVMNVLNDAVMSMPQMDPQTQQVLGYRDRMRYPFRLISG